MYMHITYLHFNIHDNCLVQEKLHKHLRLFAQQLQVNETKAPVSIYT